MKTPAYLENREWLVAKGQDADRFLSGMWTADIKRALENGVGTTGRSFLLNVKGKLVVEAVFVVLDRNSVLFSVPKGTVDQTKDALEKLLVADDVEIAIDKNYVGAWVVPQAGSELCTKLGVSMLPLSPKVPDAKDRLYKGTIDKGNFIIPTRRLSESALEIWIKDDSPPLDCVSAMTLEEFECACVRAGVTRFGHDYKADDLVLEFPHLDAISFHKGCYIGQEIVARATYRGRMTRGFAKFVFESEPHLGFLFLKGSDSQPIGKITSKCGNRALGLVRLSAILETGLVDSQGNAVVQIEEVNK